jgi:RNA polymerase sigma factor (sigma-70 family)
VESARVIGALVRVVGDLDEAEEIFGEVLTKAVERFSGEAPPDDVGAWLTRVAKSHALERLRARSLVPPKLSSLEAEAEPVTFVDDPDVVADDQLRLLFTCCHPVQPMEAQAALTLRLVAGLSTPEIAGALLVPEATMAQRIARAKRLLHERRLSFVLPGRAEHAERLDGVLKVLYLLFNEGYNAPEGSRADGVNLSEEALRLCAHLQTLLPDEAEVLGLLSLMELQASRNAARVDSAGNLVLLPDQNRGLWDRDLIRRGVGHLDQAQYVGDLGPYGLQAAIAASHAVAVSWASTNWARIASLYSKLQALVASPLVELNRAVAVSLAQGPEAALRILDGLADAPELKDYHLLPATRADLLRRLRRWPEAAREYQRAISLVQSQREREFLERRLQECKAQFSS